MPEQLQDLAEEPFRPIPDPRFLALAVAGHVQRPDLVFRDPRRDVRRLERRAGVDRHARLAEAVTRARPSPERPRSSSRRTRGSRRSLGRSVRCEPSRCPSATPPRRIVRRTRGEVPSSVKKPLGIQPPVGTPNALAARHAAWSAPVWPPLMILSSMIDDSLMALIRFGQSLAMWLGF